MGLGRVVALFAGTIVILASLSAAGADPCSRRRGIIELDDADCGAVGRILTPGSTGHAFHVGKGDWLTSLHTLGRTTPAILLEAGASRVGCRLKAVSEYDDLALLHCLDTSAHARLLLDNEAAATNPERFLLLTERIETGGHKATYTRRRLGRPALVDHQLLERLGCSMAPGLLEIAGYPPLEGESGAPVIEGPAPGALRPRRSRRLRVLGLWAGRLQPRLVEGGRLNRALLVPAAALRRFLAHVQKRRRERRRLRIRPGTALPPQRLHVCAESPRVATSQPARFLEHCGSYLGDAAFQDVKPAGGNWCTEQLEVAVQEYLTARFGLEMYARQIQDAGGELAGALLAFESSMGMTISPGRDGEEKGSTSAAEMVEVAFGRRLAHVAYQRKLATTEGGKFHPLFSRFIPDGLTLEILDGAFEECTKAAISSDGGDFERCRSSALRFPPGPTAYVAKLFGATWSGRTNRIAETPHPFLCDIAGSAVRLGYSRAPREAADTCRRMVSRARQEVYRGPSFRAVLDATKTSTEAEPKWDSLTWRDLAASPRAQVRLYLGYHKVGVVDLNEVIYQLAGRRSPARVDLGNLRSTLATALAQLKGFERAESRLVELLGSLEAAEARLEALSPPVISGHRLGTDAPADLLRSNLDCFPDTANDDPRAGLLSELMRGLMPHMSAACAVHPEFRRVDERLGLSPLGVPAFCAVDGRLAPELRAGTEGGWAVP